jgi:hypothetical protein
MSITEPSIVHAASMTAEDLALISATRGQQGAPSEKSANFQMQPCTATSSPPIPVLEDMADAFNSDSVGPKSTRLRADQPGLPPAVAAAIAKGRSHYLSSSEAHDILVNFKTYGLPVSTKAEAKPSGWSCSVF